MKRIFIFCLFHLFSQLVLFSETSVYRYALFISSSTGFNEPPLLNAKNTVQEMAWLFKEYCKVDDYQFLNDPDTKTLQDAFSRTSRIIAQRNDHWETQFFLFYYGHGLPNGLLLGNELFQKMELQSQLESIKAKLKLIILDACFSEMLGSSRYLDFNTQSEGTVFISSSRIFEPAMAKSFSPVLKAALMGDADGFTPSSLATDFFYYELYSKQQPWIQEYLKKIFNFNDNYTYLGASPDTERKVQSIFASLGYQRIPETINFQELHKKVLYNIPNNRDQTIIKNVFNYSDECALKSELTKTDICKTRSIMEKNGFKQDNYITLAELFAYLRTQLSQETFYPQTPSINLNLFNTKDPVKLAYSNDKATVIINYPGFVSIKQKTGSDIENVLSLPASLGPKTSRKIYLKPGKYIFVMNKNGVKYRAEKIITKGKRNIINESIWSDKIKAHEYFHQEDIYFTFNPKAFWSMPFINNYSLQAGLYSLLAMELHIDTSESIIGGGLNIGINYKHTTASAPFTNRFIEIPVFISLLYTSRFSNPYFFDIEVGSGFNIEIVQYDKDSLKNDWGIKGIFLSSFGVGMNLSENLALALKTMVSLAVYDNTNFYGTLSIGTEFKIKITDNKK